MTVATHNTLPSIEGIGSAKITASINVRPYFSASTGLETGNAFGHYVGSFLGDLESFIAGNFVALSGEGAVEADKFGPFASIDIGFVVEENSEVVAAIRALELVPPAESDEYDEKVFEAADVRIDREVEKYLRAKALAAGKLFNFECDGVNWVFNPS